AVFVDDRPQQLRIGRRLSRDLARHALDLGRLELLQDLRRTGGAERDAEQRALLRARHLIEPMAHRGRAHEPSASHARTTSAEISPGPSPLVRSRPPTPSAAGNPAAAAPVADAAPPRGADTPRKPAIAMSSIATIVTTLTAGRLARSTICSTSGPDLAVALPAPVETAVAGAPNGTAITLTRSPRALSAPTAFFTSVSICPSWMPLFARTDSSALASTSTAT